MLKRSMVLFAFGVAAVLFGVSQTDAQPGKGKGKGKGSGSKGGTDITRLENDLTKLLEQVKETKDKLNAAREGSGEKRGFEGKKGFDKKGFEGKKGFGGKGGFYGKGGYGKGGFGGYGKGFGKKDGEKMSPEFIKERYEHYKKLFDELPKEKGKRGFEGKKGFDWKKGFEGKKGFDKKGFEGKKDFFKKGFEGKKGMELQKGFQGQKGPQGQQGDASTDARIERLMRELEQLRSELKKTKGKKL